MNLKFPIGIHVLILFSYDLYYIAQGFILHAQVFIQHFLLSKSYCTIKWGWIEILSCLDFMILRTLSAGSWQDMIVYRFALNCIGGSTFTKPFSRLLKMLTTQGHRSA